MIYVILSNIGGDLDTVQVEHEAEIEAVILAWTRVGGLAVGDTIRIINAD